MMTSSMVIGSVLWMEEVGLGLAVDCAWARPVVTDRRGFVGHVFRDERIAGGVMDAGVSSAEVGEQLIVSDLQEEDEGARPDETLDPRPELVLWMVQVGELPEYLRRDHGRALLEFADERVERLLRGQDVSRDAERLVGCHGPPRRRTPAAIPARRPATWASSRMVHRTSVSQEPAVLQAHHSKQPPQCLDNHRDQDVELADLQPVGRSASSLIPEITRFSTRRRTAKHCSEICSVGELPIPHRSFPSPY
jgi:hypothetical protein